MTVIFGILLALSVFFVVVMIHEYGHFIAARSVGMRVLEFGLWIPPKIKKVFTDKKGTDFTLNALPIGGFVRIDGENFASPTAFSDGAFMSKSLPKRLLVLVAGVMMNILLAWAIFTGLFLVGTKPLGPIPFEVEKTNSFFLPSFDEAISSGFIISDGVILRPIDGSVASRSGILAGDVVNAIDGEKIRNVDDFIKKIADTRTPTKTLTILRGEGEMKISVVPENQKIGAYVGEAFRKNENFEKKFWLWESLQMGISETYQTSILTFSLLGKTLSGLFSPKDLTEYESAKNNLSGPIGAGKAFVTMVELKTPLSLVLIFVALLSVNLAVMNILPFPALDGGRIVTTILYSFFVTLGFSRQKILRMEGYINTFGFVLLLIFMLYVAGLDIMRILTF